MKNLFKYYIPVFLIAFILTGCSKKNSNSSVRIGIPSDIETTNPMFAFGTTDGSISELLYLSLAKHSWNSEKGDIEPKPMLAKSLSWNADSTQLDVILRDDVKWSDGENLTSDDVVFSFDVYSDPETTSKFFGLFKKFYLLASQKVNIEKSFEIISPYHLKINFVPNSLPNFNDIDYPILPKHVYSKVNRKDLPQKEKELPVVSNGPFTLKHWEKDEFISLTVNKNSFLYSPAAVNEIIFKVIPNINNRLIQLKTGEIDLIENVRPDDAAALKSNSALIIAPVKGRSYDYIGWNEIDPIHQSAPNRFFSSPKTRVALTYAVNREEILNEFLGGYGQLAIGPVTPIFKKAVNPALSPYPFDTEKAKELLKEDGWKDSDGDGVIEKNGIKFSFDLAYLPDKPHRKNAVTVIKNNLEAVGIKVNPVPMEKGVFLENIFSKKYNAWLAGWTVPIPIELNQFWNSDEKAGNLNLGTYKNIEADKLLNMISNAPSNEIKFSLYKKFQEIMYKDEPFTFLYWTDNIVVYNGRIKNININPMGVIQECWKWRIEE